MSEANAVVERKEKESKQDEAQHGAAEAGEAAAGGCEQRSANDDDGSSDEINCRAARIPLSARVSAVLFVATKPMDVDALAHAAAVKPETIERVLPKISALYDDEVHGFSLQEVAGAWQFRTAPGAAASVHRMIPKSARRLSRAAAESLAVIAYKQPVQRAEIEAIRGVDALPTLKTLLDARLIRIVGRENSAGRPALYGTTDTFLEKFGLSDLSELPSPREIAELLEDPGETADDDIDAHEAGEEQPMQISLVERIEQSSEAAARPQESPAAPQPDEAGQGPGARE